MAVTLFTGCQSKPIKTNITQNSTKIVEQEKSSIQTDSIIGSVFSEPKIAEQPKK